MRNGLREILSPVFYNLTMIFGAVLGSFCIGITVGAVVVPQSMAYAKLALLPVEFGLYSSFMGVLIYWFFATSKDITIGVGDGESSIGNPLLTLLARCCHVYRHRHCRR